tara:strand:- start:1651 stop:2280 length:630 start_codon:yes stop_codon:yes gene_type:complete
MDILYKKIINTIKSQNILYNKREDLSEGLKYHVDNNIPLHSNIFRMGSKNYFNLFVEARKLIKENKINLTDENDIWLMENTEIGKFDYYNGKKVPLDYPYEFTLNEAEYKGKKVELNKPKRASSGKKKFIVYTKKPAKKTKRNPKGYTIVKVGFGQPGMRISKNAAARKSFLARHKCDTDPGPKWKARYWSCNIHRYKKQLGLKFPGRW